MGRGTFAPVKVDHLKNHKMHTETYYFDEKIERKFYAQTEGKKVFCVGTTSLRHLESAVDKEGLLDVEPGSVYSTDIFLHGVNVRSISGMITNFHLPSLLFSCLSAP